MITRRLFIGLAVMALAPPAAFSLNQVLDNAQPQDCQRIGVTFAPELLAAANEVIE
jgi:hypothetical protein